MNVLDSHQNFCTFHPKFNMTFNVAGCISLHNAIVARAIAQLPDELQLTIIRNWFTTYNVNISNPGLPVELTEPLKEFLSGVDIVKPAVVPVE